MKECGVKRVRFVNTEGSSAALAPLHVTAAIVRFTVTAALGMLLRVKRKTGLLVVATVDVAIEGGALVNATLRQHAVVTDSAFSLATSSFIMRAASSCV